MSARGIVLRRFISFVVPVLLIAGAVEVAQFVSAPRAARAHADVVTGTAGLFVPVTPARVMDTRSGKGGYTTPMTATVWRTLQVTGVGGVPATGVSAVAVTVTAVSPAGGGVASVMPAGSSMQPITALIYDNGTTGNQSGSAISAVSADGKMQLRTQTATDLLVDVQGYFTAGNGTTAAGGYVPVAPTRIVNTVAGVGFAAGRWAGGSTHTITAGGVAGVPADASAVFVTFTPISYSTTDSPYLTAYPHGVARPTASLNFAPNVATAIGASVDLDSLGRLDLYVGPATAPVDVMVDVVGYYTATSANGQGGFTPAATRVFDSRRAAATAIAANTVRTVPVAGIAGVPLAGAGISAVAVSLQAINGTHSSGYLRVWGSDQPEPTTTSMLNYPTGATSIRSDFQIVRVGADGAINVRNACSCPIDVVVDVEGWFSTLGTAVASGQSRTQQAITLQAAAGGGGGWVTYKYRTGTTGSFVTVPPADAGTPGWPLAKSGGSFPARTWDLTATLAAATGTPSPADTLVQVQACYGSSSTDPNPLCAVPSNIGYVRNAFGDSYATTSFGPGSVSLLTGNYQISATDVAVPSYRGSLSLGRTFTALPTPVENTGATGVFGPGWTADLTGPDSGAASLSVTDQTASGYLVFTDSDGSSSLYQATTSTGSYPISFAGVGDAAGDGATVTKTSATEIRMLDQDGTTTIWGKPGSAWQVSSVQQAESNSTSSYSYDPSNLVTRILGPVPAGVSCASPDTTPGCRSLTLGYTTVTGKTRLQTVVFHAYDPVTAAMAAVEVARYDYDGNARLSAAWDPRISPNLKTTYSYDGTGRIATLTPPGLAAWTLGYDTGGRVSTAARYDAALSQTAVSTLVYGVPVSGTGAPVDLSSTAAAAWGQTDDLPYTATAVFGPDHQPASTTASSVNAADWPYATISYLDVNGRETNTASYGAGAWQYGATAYDRTGNTTSSLTAGNRAQALSPTADTDATAAAAATIADRAALITSTTGYDPLHPDRAIDTYGPIHPVVLADGTPVHARAHAHTIYDEGAPTDANGDPIAYGLPTTGTSSAWTTDGVDHDPVTSRTGYGAAAIGGSKTGWDLHAATSTTTVGAATGGGDLVRNTRYDDTGAVVRSWLPGSTGADARSTSTSYYTATGTGSCVSAALAGLACSTGPTAQPATGNPLPVATTTYNLYSQPLTVTETAGGTVRTNSTVYDPAGRVNTTSTVVTPTADGGTPLPTVTTTYDPATGLPLSQTAGGQTLTTAHDTLGRVASYTDAGGNTATTTYDLSGQVATLNDGKGTTSYTYDSATEHRGLVTAQDVGVGTAPGTFTATYDADGSLVSQTYPNGLVATKHFDNTGTDTSLGYAKAGTPWISFSQAADAHGRTVHQSSPASSQVFGYDTAGRLTKTSDTVTGTPTSACATRVYTLDNNSNRTSLTAYPAATGGACSTSTTPVTTASTFDGADRITTTGYRYDTLERTLTVPAGDAQGIGSHAATTGTLNLGYYANDILASQTQGAATLTFTLDPSRDRFVATSDGTTTTTNHYADSSDSPAWTSTSATAWTRNLLGIDGGLAGTVDQTGTITLELANLHGDLVATAADDPAATAVASYSESTEYGAPRSLASAPDSYGWVGGERRSTNDLGGLTLMGVRLYNPTTARFLSVDPVPGGTDNPYAYSLSPIDRADLSGMFETWWRDHIYLRRDSARRWISLLKNGGNIVQLISESVGHIPYWLARVFAGAGLLSAGVARGFADDIRRNCGWDGVDLFFWVGRYHWYDWKPSATYFALGRGTPHPC